MERLTLTVEETAEQLGIGRNLAYRQIRAGKIPAIRLGGKWVIPVFQLNKFLNNFKEVQSGKDTEISSL